ncbi:T9SS type A sorting domain-containing protein [Dyadobacter pollutisoli]|uniref:T9SS type A sorting domain-containing protein n=1 Tax=Dyadobacter pollutisoli TaxID=2910158 RepID=A0A9E8SK21_9BACT|nr:T9SS type A sorting domain-containing protein [Dyadobacter pollutisoli]WAC11493.1 T9SS type A sorting domain-containing protein [Dyadobacter pollutisoli]
MEPPFKSSMRVILFYIIFLTGASDAFAQDWSEIIKITAQNNGGSSSRHIQANYGGDVAISGNYAIAGSRFNDTDADGLNLISNAGAAYILFNNAGTWAQVKKITSPVRDAEIFGGSVSIAGDYAVVGAELESLDASESNVVGGAGAVYIFKKDQGGSGNWGLIKKVVAPVRAENDFFGRAVSINGDYLVVGVNNEDQDSDELNTLLQSGAAYIFKKDQGGSDNWGLIKKITASTRGAGDLFGEDVSIDGDYVIVGSPRDSEDANEANPINEAGSAYIFKKDQGGSENWGQIKKFTAPVREATDHFASAVSIGASYAIVGAPQENEDAAELNTLADAGSVYIFKKEEGGTDNWGEIKKITAPVRKSGDFFGLSVSITQDYLIVGAPTEDEDASEANNIGGAGSAYIFKKDLGGIGNWGFQQKIVASLRAPSDAFGWSVSISASYIFVGMPGDDEDALEANTLESAGSAYIFGMVEPLPVTLTTFNAVKNENQVLLTWATTMESNSDYFDIQKSGDGRVWDTLGRVLAAVKSDQLRSYSFTDYNPWHEDSPGHENLYRLKMVDHASDGLDRSFAYSRIISLSFGNNPRIILYPNPVSDKLYCNPADAANIESITMVNSAGQIMFRAFGDRKTSVSVDGLTPGIYLAQIRKKAGTVQTQKVLVVRFSP